MKKLAMAITLVGCICLLSAAYAYEWQSQDNATPKKYPAYLLVIRYWGTVMESHGDYALPKQGWIYLNETYDSMDEVVNRLNTYAGQGMTAEGKKNELVGLWQLGEDCNIVDQLQLDEIKHSKERKIEVDEWSEWKWKAKSR